MRSKLALPENAIVLPSNNDVAQLTGGIIDLYHQPNSPYHLAEHEIAVDLFCGAGGTSEGILQALGESPAFAVNHNADAIGVHDINHPLTIHLESDVFAAAPQDHIPPDKAIGLLAASPACTHFSTAHGGKPLDREIRDQAWVVANWCEHPDRRFNPRVVVVENVREFLTWAPLTAENKIDKRFIDKNGIGSIFKEWRNRLIAAGYKVEYQILNAADYGVPTKRKRLLIVARRDGLPIRFPSPTHAPRNSKAVLEGKLSPYAAASSCIDFKIQCNPIFMYPEDAKMAGANRPLAPKSLARIAAGIERYVIDTNEPFIISNDDNYKVENSPSLTVSRPLIAAHMAQHNANNVGHPVTEPISTMTTKVCHQQVVTSHMLTLRQNCFGQSMNEPISAICAAGNHHGEVRANFVSYYSDGMDQRSGLGIIDKHPNPTNCAVGAVPIDELGLTEEQRFDAWWIARFLEIYGSKPKGNPNTAHLAGPRPSAIGRPGALLWSIQMRMLAPKEAFAASSFPAHYMFEKRSDGKSITKSGQMQLVGNAVPPGLAKAIIGANLKPRPSIARRIRTSIAIAA